MKSKERQGSGRREFLKQSTLLGAGLWMAGGLSAAEWAAAAPSGKMRMGLVTYLWAQDWDLPTLISKCEQGGMLGVELRTQHAHGVEPSLTAAQRAEVKQRFADSPVECIGYGSNQEFHSPDPQELRANIEGTFELIKLCADIGASGVKVKPNNLPDNVPVEKTIAQIGQALNEIGRYASDYGQVIRLEVHGRKTAEIPHIKAIFDHVTEPNVGACWNCNEQDLLPPGLEANFHSIQSKLGDTVHVRELNQGDYPYPELFKLFHSIQYTGWILLEGRAIPKDRVAGMKEQVAAFHQLVAQSS